jgi:glucose uptake protein GlcU
MLRRLLAAVVGLAMGGLIGLVPAFLGLGTRAIVGGAVLGALAFSIVLPLMAPPPSRGSRGDRRSPPSIPVNGRGDGQP